MSDCDRLKLRDSHTLYANKINTYGRDSRSFGVGRLRRSLSIHCQIVVYHWETCNEAQYLMKLKIEVITSFI